MSSRIIISRHHIHYQDTEPSSVWGNKLFYFLPIPCSAGSLFAWKEVYDRASRRAREQTTIRLKRPRGTGMSALLWRVMGAVVNEQYNEIIRCCGGLGAFEKHPIGIETAPSKYVDEIRGRLLEEPIIYTQKHLHGVSHLLKS